MSVPIIYLVTVPDLAQTGLDGSAALINDDLTALNIAVLATVGGLMTVHIIATGAGLTSGQYNNLPIISTIAGGQGATVNINVNAAGYILSTAVQVVIPGYGYTLSSFGVNLATIGTAGSTLATWAITAILPCSAPFPIGTKYVELSCDANGPAFITFDSTLTSMGITNGILTTQQSTLTTLASRIAANQVMLRRVTAALPLIAGAPPAEGFTAPISLQVIMGTAAA